MDNEYTTRSVTPADLPRLAELISCPELADRKDIAFEQSKVVFDDDDSIASFIILKRRSVQDFFGGEIPPDNVLDTDYEGEESWGRENLRRRPADEQFELMYSYCNGKHYGDIDNYFIDITHIFLDLAYVDGLTIWAENCCKFIVPPIKKKLINFHNVISFFNVIE